MYGNKVAFEDSVLELETVKQESRSVRHNFNILRFARVL